MIINNAPNQPVSQRRFCVPIGVHQLHHMRRSDIAAAKKQTVHVGYGYASGDNYRLGYNQGGMGGISESFNGKVMPNGGDIIV